MREWHFLELDLSQLETQHDITEEKEILYLFYIHLFFGIFFTLLTNL